jgi:hypothetical protein
MRGYLAETLLEWGTLQAQGKDLGQAVKLLGEAKLEFEEIGAPIYAQIAADRMAGIEATR